MCAFGVVHFRPAFFPGTPLDARGSLAPACELCDLLTDGRSVELVDQLLTATFRVRVCRPRPSARERASERAPSFFPSYLHRCRSEPPPPPLNWSV